MRGDGAEIARRALAAYSSSGRSTKLSACSHAEGSFCALCRLSITVCASVEPAERSTYGKPETGWKRRMTCQAQPRCR